MTAKELLLHETDRAYDYEEMSLLTGVRAWKWDEATHSEMRAPERDLSDDLARMEPRHWHQGIFAILEHVADCKIMYMEQAFGKRAKPFPLCDGTLESLLVRLDAAQQHLRACLEQLSSEQLNAPTPTRFHGETAANLFWVLVQHDSYHGAQIEMLRQEFERRRRGL